MSAGAEVFLLGTFVVTSVVFFIGVLSLLERIAEALEDDEDEP